MTDRNLVRDSGTATGVLPRPFTIAALLSLAAWLALAIDFPVATFVKAARTPSWLDELLANSETFGHGMGVTLILIAVWVLDPGRRSTMLGLVGGSLGAGLVANTAKLIIARTRPRSLDLTQGSVWDSFGRWFPGDLGNAGQSFPSGHTATAVGLAVMLTARYPHGRWYFAVMAALVGLQRIECSAHYPSDVLAGAAIGWLVAWGVLVLADRRARAVRQESE